MPGDEKDPRPECCREDENLYRPEPFKGFMRCKVCERRHFRMVADPARINARGAGM